MKLEELSHWLQLPTSFQVLWIADLLCILGVVGALLSGASHFRAARAGGGPANRWNSVTVGFAYGTLGTLGTWVYFRWVEVNHFPSQSMAEVLVMFTLALVVSIVVLHHALALHRRGPGWAILDDALLLLVLASVAFTHNYVRGLVTAQRDLPPALQSYWFPPHLSALIFSYATMGIAGLICMVYFSARFWSSAFARGTEYGGLMLTAATLATGLLFSGLRGHLGLGVTVVGMASVVLLAVLVVPRILPDRAQGSTHARTQPLVFVGLSLVPFAHIVTLPVLVLTGLVFLGLRLAKALPAAKTISSMERELDDVSFRAFAVGMPFLTAGLFMGAFWAQEAWANYWGWDSKENSALISWLVYVVYIHLRMLGGYRGDKAMAVLMGGALSIFITFQVFGYMPDSQKSLHRYTDDGVQAQEGMQGARDADDSQAKLDK